MIDELSRMRIYNEAFALLARVGDLLMAARAEHEQKVAELAGKRKAA
jgi:hypothetical protein